VVSQLSGLMAYFFNRRETAAPARVDVRGARRAAPALSHVDEGVHLFLGMDMCSALVAYLVLSYAALLTVLIWLLVRHLK
jgi:hypothetical protein